MSEIVKSAKNTDAAVIGRAVMLPGGRSKWGGRLRFGKRRHLDELHRVPTRNLSMKKGALVDGNAGYLYFICRTDRIKLCLH